ncbi:putative pyridoxal kinase [Mortierella alpina]|uniref:pyridoxal kinase n=1 Tax=Mortierella alpina TaxID=64518 RepID=A0A9P6M4L3_MORAP|nr:putative pyridoxal kinase [Mortierella alpina]
MFSPRVLSIQSHIVSGYCGNKAATFPLQLLGFDVDVMNTVSFSNHTGYPSWTGEKATGEQLTKLFEGLEANGLVEYTHILTAYSNLINCYIGSAQNLTAVTEIISQLKAQSNPFFDPVMGDNGQLYVQPDVIPIYRELMKFASAITPNQFEAEVLADKKITDVKSCLEVIEILHNTGVEYVVLTSVALSPRDIAEHTARSSATNGYHNGSQESGQTGDDSMLYCICSSKVDQELKVHAISFPTYDGYFTGTGDLFSALLVARLDEAIHEEAQTKLRASHANDHKVEKQLGPLAEACVKVVATMKAVVLRTYQAQKGATAAVLDRTQASSSAVIKRCELRLIQSKADIEHPDKAGVAAVALRV